MHTEHAQTGCDDVSLCRVESAFVPVCMCVCARGYVLFKECRGRMAHQVSIIPRADSSALCVCICVCVRLCFGVCMSDGGIVMCYPSSPMSYI